MSKNQHCPDEFSLFTDTFNLKKQTGNNSSPNVFFKKIESYELFLTDCYCETTQMYNISMQPVIVSANVCLSLIIDCVLNCCACESCLCN